MTYYLDSSFCTPVLRLKLLGGTCMQTLCITRKMTGAWRAALASIGLELRDSATKGCGVYALAAFAAGQRLLAEEQ